MSAFLKTTGFVLIFPFNVALTIPYFLRVWYRAGIDFGAMSWIGPIIFLAGGILLCWSVGLFWLRGQGTPTVWFLKRLRFIIGEETVSLVASHLYKYTRNPMYIGVLAMVFGQAIWFGSPAVSIYGISLIVIFNAFIRIIEEPRLRKKYGAEYDEFCERVPRWFW